MDAQEALDLLSDHKAAIRLRFGVRKLAIFGSVARGDAIGACDLDVLVEFVDRPTFDNYMGLKLYLEQLARMRVDLAIKGDLRPALRERIERKALNVP
jgi:hypothetical protein